MTKRNTIGFYFVYNEQWIGGAYYIINIIKTLNFLDDTIKPNIVILSFNNPDFNSIKELNYPFIEYIVVDRAVLPKWQRGINKISKIFLSSVLFKQRIPSANIIDIIFPAPFNPRFDIIPKKVFWRPDFQECHLPHFFDKKELLKRQKENKRIQSEAKYLIFSSVNARHDFDKFYPNSKIKKYVFKFSSVLPDISNISLSAVLSKYHLSTAAYFFSPNQFWQHKNHIIILKALKKMKEKGGVDFKVYFSGKEHDARNPDYFDGLQQYVLENHLEENVRFLGFIDRTDQLCLMKHAVAIIQPSLFEGWSTVVEDAKALNQHIIVSNIPVNKEQLGEQGFYFDPYKEDSLIEQITCMICDHARKHDFNYTESIKRNAHNFLQIMDAINANKD
jgi:glycosyltransferase involved in cell wall biosynthesis